MKKILVVEDSGITRLHLNRILKDAGYKVFEAVNGQQVINDCFHREYSLGDMDLIILDLYLRDMYGLEVLKKIALKYPDIPVIILSSEKKKGNILDCIDMGAKDYIVKPFKEKDLVQRVGRILPPDPVEGEGGGVITSSGKKEDISSALTNEIDRAIRSKTPLALAKYVFKEENSSLEEIRSIASEKLRVIDQVYKVDNGIVLILPATDKKGEAVVAEKLQKAWKEIKEDIKFDKSETKKLFFPDDIEDQKLIQDYKKDKIKDIIIEKLGL